MMLAEFWHPLLPYVALFLILIQIVPFLRTFTPSPLFVKWMWRHAPMIGYPREGFIRSPNPHFVLRRDSLVPIPREGEREEDREKGRELRTDSIASHHTIGSSSWEEKIDESVLIVDRGESEEKRENDVLHEGEREEEEVKENEKREEKVKERKSRKERKISTRQRGESMMVDFERVVVLKPPLSLTNIAYTMVWWLYFLVANSFLFILNFVIWPIYFILFMCIGFFLFFTKLLAVPRVSDIWLNTWQQKASGREGIIVLGDFNQMLVDEVFFESLPQLVMQLLNNRSRYSKLAIVTLSFSLLIITNNGLKFAYYVFRKKQHWKTVPTIRGLPKKKEGSPSQPLLGVS